MKVVGHGRVFFECKHGELLLDAFNFLLVDVMERQPNNTAIVKMRLN